MRPLLPCLLFALLTPSVSLAASVTVSPIKDNTLFGDPAGALSSGVGIGFFVGNNSVSNTRRGVIAFNLDAVVPAGATIDSVSLLLFVSSAPNETPQPITLHLLLSDWGEGTSASSGGGGAQSTSGDATWLHTFYPNQLWASAGGDFAPSPSAETIVSDSGHHVWSDATMVSDVQGWIDKPDANFGWLLKGNESAASTVRRFDSREHVTVEHRPTLTIHYTPVLTPIKVLTWGACKALYMFQTGREP